MNNAAKKHNVAHSIRPKTHSISTWSARISKNNVPSKAIHPKLRLSWGIEWRQNKVMTNARVAAHLYKRLLSNVLP